MDPRSGRHLLSSNKLTWQYQYFWPGFIAVYFIGMTALVWYTRAIGDHAGAIRFSRVLIPVIGMVAAACAMYYSRGMKRVEMDDAGLYVGALTQQVFVPFSEIEKCDVNWRSKGAVPVVTVWLRQPTVFGSQIAFIAALPWNNDHSVVAELRERRDLARKQSKNP